jgi:hypothetical protein
MANDLEQELKLAKASRDEWMQRWQFAERRIIAVWDDALHTARVRIRNHSPRCLDLCANCWMYDEIGKLLRGDAHNYIPIKERSGAGAEELLKEADRRAQKDDQFFYDSYEQGVRDTLALVDKMIGEHE